MVSSKNEENVSAAKLLLLKTIKTVQHLDK